MSGNLLFASPLGLKGLLVVLKWSTSMAFCMAQISWLSAMLHSNRRVPSGPPLQAPSSYSIAAQHSLLLLASQSLRGGKTRATWAASAPRSCLC